MTNKSLEVLGFKSGHDTQHLQRSNPQILVPNRFFDQANALMEKAEPIVLDEVIPHLEQHPGRWNPGGFMAFPLGVHDVLGSLRFHVYPRGIPRETDQGPNIHNHGWHLFSRVLIGHYRDIIYSLENQGRVTDTNYNLEERGLIRLYKTERKPNGLDFLVTDGTVVRAVPVDNKDVSAGRYHTIEANVIYHLTTIPQDQLTATLVLDSPAFVYSTDVLISSASPQLTESNSGIEEIARQRRNVNFTTAVLAKNQLMSAIRTRKPGQTGVYLP
jgi:hypothetical protein